METLRSFLTPLLPFFALYLTAMAAECLLLFARSRASRPRYDWGEAATNVLSWMTAVVAWIPINLLTFGVSGWLWQFRVADLGSSAGAWLLAALAWDFSYYWQHRAEHEVRLLWAGHVTHHSSEQFNYSNGFRQSWTPWTGFIFYPAWALLGVRPELLFIAGGWNLVYQFFLHTELVPKLPAGDRSVAEHAVAPSCPPRQEPAVPRPQLRRRADRVGPPVRHLRARARGARLRNPAARALAQSALDPGARVRRDRARLLAGAGLARPPRVADLGAAAWRPGSCIHWPRWASV